MYFDSKDKLKNLLNDIHGFLLEHRKKTPTENIQGVEKIECKYPILERQHQQKLKQNLSRLHSADIAHILEGLPLGERLCIWEQIPTQKTGEILLELSDPVSTTLLE